MQFHPMVVHYCRDIAIKYKICRLGVAMCVVWNRRSGLYEGVKNTYLSGACFDTCGISLTDTGIRRSNFLVFEAKDRHVGQCSRVLRTTSCWISLEGVLTAPSPPTPGPVQSSGELRSRSLFQ